MQVSVSSSRSVDRVRMSSESTQWDVCSSNPAQNYFFSNLSSTLTYVQALIFARLTHGARAYFK